MFMRVVCILTGGNEYTIDGIRFEFTELFGPAVVGKMGQILAKQPGPRHRLWKVVTLWAQQGKRVTKDGECIYDVPREPQYVRLAGRQYVHVPEGRAPEDVRREWFKKLKVRDPEDNK